MKTNKFLGIDVGGTDIKYAVLDINNQIFCENSIPTPHEKEKFVDALVNIINEYEEIDGVGISMPGFIDASTGYMKTAGALTNLYEQNLVELLQEEGIRVPIHVENDAKCAAISELANGNAKNVSDFVCITIGTGVGGAVVVGGELVKGKSFAAGEFGIMRQDINSNKSVSEVGAIMPSRIAYSEKYKINLSEVDGRMALSDKTISDEFYKNISRLIYNLIFVLNPEKILLGGAISKDDKFINRVRQELENSGIDKNIHYKIEQCKNGNNAGLIGAVHELKKII